jgi:N-acetylmuramoyl-L-alanine amidase
LATGQPAATATPASESPADIIARIIGHRTAAIHVLAVAAGPTPGPPASPTPTAAPPTPTATPVQVFLDPGHGGVDTGTIGVADDGSEVDEKTIALALAQQTAAHLRADGISVALSRTDDSLVGATPADYTADGSELTPDGVLADLQRRIDRANASGARVYLSIHLNAYDDPSIAGTQTFYDGARSFANRNLAFANLVQNSVMDALHAQGYTTPDRGITDDQILDTESLGSLNGYNHLVVLGPAIPGVLRSTNMPGALIETLFLSNPPEATAAIDPAVQALLAGAFTRAIEQYLRTP